ncbi:MAG: acyltransferase [Caulobacter sp.]|nr:acyltransferase [Caulobacter sp.]
MPVLPPDASGASTVQEVPPAAARPARPSTRGGALDFLRFAASLLIVLYHFGAEGPMRIERFSQVFSRGFLATDFFLMLSGYVLGRAYGASTLSGRISHGRFWIRRVGRVWPGHLVVLAMMAALVLVLNAMGTDAHKPSRFAWDQLPVQALLVHAWGFNSDGWNLPSWSLSALVVCYAIFPFLWRAADRIRHPWVLPLIGAAVVLAFEIVARTVFDHALADLQFRYGVIRALPMFILGVCLARTVDMDWPSERAAKALLIGGCVLLAAMQPLDRYALPDELIFDLPCLAAIAAIVLGAGRLPVRRPQAWIEEGAKLSFALFITHILVGVIYWSAVHELIDTVPIGIGWQWLMWLASFPIALGAAWLFHTYIDQPLQDRLAPWLRGR